MNTLEAKIRSIGQRMVMCSEHCAGVRRNQQLGAIPRCLVLETNGRSTARGAAVVGINPGKASTDEEAFYRDRGVSYEAVLEWFFSEAVVRPQYYIKLRRLLKALEITGPILWTELAKCETSGTRLTIQTLRHCTRQYLNDELTHIPEDWPLIGVGTEVFKALAYLYPNRRVLGIPHPTGSRGHFDWLFDVNDQLCEASRRTTLNVLDCREPIAEWLSADRLDKSAITPAR